MEGACNVLCLKIRVWAAFVPNLTILSKLDQILQIRYKVGKIKQTTATVTQNDPHNHNEEI
jgi:hypothetical protein